MASADLRKELECSVCLNIYKDPMNLRCGHNFCQDCIVRVLDTQGASGGYSCPECRAGFQDRPALQRNITLRNIVENFLPAWPDQEQSGVLCTYCIHTPVPAVRSCVMCEASLCDNHLRVHSKAPEHVLCDPTTSLEDWKCSVHKKILVYYCMEDSACICVSCSLDGEHQGHQVETLAEASEKKKKKLRNVLQKLTEREKTEKTERVQSLEERRRKVQGQAAGDTKRVAALFRDLRRRLKDIEKGIPRDISERTEQTSIYVSDIIQGLEIKKDELSRKMRHIEELCNMTDPLPVLQEADTDVTLESPCVNWEIACKNVSPMLEIPPGQDESRAKARRGFSADRCRYVLITLCAVSLISLIAIIALSTQLFQVSWQYDEASHRLGLLRQGEVNSTSGALTQDSVLRGLQRTLAQAEEDLEATRTDLGKIRQQLERTVQEKDETEDTATKLRGDLREAGNKLQEKDEELTTCAEDLKSAILQTRNGDQTISEMRTSLSEAEQKLKIKEREDLEDTKKTIQQVQSDLQKSVRGSQHEAERMKNMGDRLSEVEDWMKDVEVELSDLKKKLGGATECFRQSCSDVNASEQNSDSICPGGWKQIDQTCYYFSTQNKPRIKADEDCKKRNSTLAKIQEGDSTLKALIRKDGRSFWIGLRRLNGTWRWWDDSVQVNFPSGANDWCARATPGLEGHTCSKLLPWICQKKGRQCRLGAPELRCVGEKMGVIGEKMPGK